ncbi:MAG: grasp-with-spasm system SPASM domain peptide maturase [Flavobacteriales bacterium]|nr:grasp-with-spasm system SPASM domain peptide maturase [Flavobacteriales bacterium]MCB9335470.1 grasp-with-spasm system SPASM domain peptide maturase [Flavobacteriales bacterium]
MRRNEKYLKLFACCLVIKGAKNILLLDVQRGKTKQLPLSMYYFIEDAKTLSINTIKKKYKQSIDVVNEYIHFLIDNEYAFIIDEHELSRFPHLSLEWDFSSNINNAIVDVYDLNNYDYKTVINQLNELNCFSIAIRLFSKINKQDIISILKELNHLSYRAIELLVDFDSFGKKEAFVNLTKDFPKLISLNIYNFSLNKTERYGVSKCIVTYSTKKSISDKDCGAINVKYFTPNIKHFTESLYYNTCLNRKISIDVNGEIKNCPSMQKSYGNIKNTTLEEVLNKLDFKELWNIKKDNIKVCQDCEYRHICTDCRAFRDNPNDIFSHPAKCNYNPYQAKWKGEEGYIAVTEMTEEEIKIIKEGNA